MSRRRRWIRAAAAAVTLSLALAACSDTDVPETGRTSGQEPPLVMADGPPSPLHGTRVDPPLPRPTQVLRDTSGQQFSVGNRPADELTVLFFGYTHCPDVCPTTMADLASARAQIPESMRDGVTVVFVTEDPERDTPRSLRRWLDGFDPSFIGLTGGNRATEEMLEHLYLPGTKRMPQPKEPIRHPGDRDRHGQHGTYGVGHTGVVYAFGPAESTVIYSGGTQPSEYATDFVKLLNRRGE